MNIFHNYLPPHPELACLELAVACKIGLKLSKRKLCFTTRREHIEIGTMRNIAKNQIVTGCCARHLAGVLAGVLATPLAGVARFRPPKRPPAPELPDRKYFV